MNNLQLKEFFDALDNPYTNWQMSAGWHDDELVSLPYYFLANQLAATTFKYAGYENTAVVRDQSSRDKIVIEMLKESLNSNEKPVIFDCGTYDGVRLKRILDALPSHENVGKIFGIDSNNRKLEEAVKLFSGTEYDFVPVNERIENVDMKKLSENPEIWRDDSKKIILGLENIFLNFNGLSFYHNQGLTGFLSKMTAPGDEIILEAHNIVDKDTYPEDVESFFTNYFNESGLKEVIGGKLKSEFNNYGKFIFITKMKNYVRFNKAYDFSSRTIHKKNGIGDADPRIYIGFSGVVPYNKLFEFLVFNFANNLYVPKRQDIEFSGNDMVLKLRNFEHDLWINDAKEKSGDFSYPSYGDHEGSVKNNSGLTAYITLKDLQPHYYNAFIYKNSDVFGVQPEAMKIFIDRSKWDRKIYPPITKAFPQTSFEKLQFSETDKMSLHP